MEALPNEIFFEILSYLDYKDLLVVEKTFTNDIPLYLYKFAHKRLFSKSITGINNMIYVVSQDESQLVNESRRILRNISTKYHGCTGSFLLFSSRYINKNNVTYPKSKEYNRYAYKNHDDDECGHSPYTGVSTYTWWKTQNGSTFTDGMITDDFIYTRKPM